MGKAGVAQNLPRFAVIVVMNEDTPRQHAERSLDDAHVLIQHKVLNVGTVE